MGTGLLLLRRFAILETAFVATVAIPFLWWVFSGTLDTRVRIEDRASQEQAQAAVKVLSAIDGADNAGFRFEGKRAILEVDLPSHIFALSEQQWSDIDLANQALSGPAPDAASGMDPAEGEQQVGAGQNEPGSEVGRSIALLPSVGGRVVSNFYVELLAIPQFLLLLLTAALLLHLMPVPAPVLAPMGRVQLFGLFAAGFVLEITIGLGISNWLLPPSEELLALYRELSRGVAFAIVACVLAPIAEELVFRRWLLAGLLADRVPFAVTIQALAFALPHGLLQGVGGVVGALIWGLIAGGLYRRTGRLLPLIILHSLHNALFLLTVYLSG